MQPPEVICEKDVLKNFANFTGKNCIKKRLQHRCFPMKFAKILITPILKNFSERKLILNIPSKYQNFLITYAKWRENI